MSLRAKTAYFVRSALGSMVRSPFVHVIAVASLTLALLGFGLTRIGSGQIAALLGAWGSDVELTVYLAPEATAEQVEELERALRARTAGTVSRVSPSEALGRLAAQLEEHGRALADLPENPLPWTLEVRLPNAAGDVSTLRDLAGRARALPFVTAVDWGEEAIERLTIISRALSLASGLAFALVFLTAVIVVSATLQLAIFARREEIEIQKLVGATDRFVRIPFLIEGLAQGLLAGACAFGLAVAVVRLVESERASSLAFLRLGGRIVVSWPRLAMEQLGIGVALGLLGSFVAVRRFLRV